jgi:hypothetical protein
MYCPELFIDNDEKAPSGVVTELKVDPESLDIYRVVV